MKGDWYGMILLSVGAFMEQQEKNIVLDIQNLIEENIIRQ